MVIFHKFYEFGMNSINPIDLEMQNLHLYTFYAQKKYLEKFQ